MTGSGHPVLAEIERRRAGSATPGTKLALAIEGGGMRAAITSGMCSALESFGISPDIFDIVYGSSAGSVIGAFYLAEQIRAGTPVFYEDIVDTRFIDLKRVVGRKPIMNLDFLVREVITERRRLQYQRVLDSKKWRAIATNVDTGRRDVLGPPTSLFELQEFMHASESIPLVAESPYEVEGRRYVDASISEAVPWNAAVDEGASHVLVLSSRPLGLGKRASVANTLMSHVWTRRYGPELRELVRSRTSTSGSRAAQMMDMTLTPANGDPSYVFAICPPDGSSYPSNLSQSAPDLVEACKLGFNSVASAFGFSKSDEFNVANYFDRIR